MDQERLSLPEAAHALRITWSQCYDLVLRGRLRGEKMSGRWLVDPQSVEEEARRRTVEV